MITGNIISAQIENIAFMTFFDLAQEFDDVEDFHNLCVAIPKSFFNLDARLYLMDTKANTLLLTATTNTRRAIIYSSSRRG